MKLAAIQSYPPRSRTWWLWRDDLVWSIVDALCRAPKSRVRR